MDYRRIRRAVLGDRLALMIRTVLASGCPGSQGSRSRPILEKDRVLANGVCCWTRFPAEFVGGLAVVERRHVMHETNGNGRQGHVTLERTADHRTEESREFHDGEWHTDPRRFVPGGLGGRR